jgi:CRISPR-associated exonuclease Cas4
MGVAVFAEDELLPISALQHLVFCERQWALIHLEQLWSENRLTVEGRILHDRVHETESESRGDTRIARGLRLHSLRLGLIGIADVVEFYRVTTEPGVKLAHAPGLWRPLPIEYKRGRPKPDQSDEVQLCAQALCLEETFRMEIPAGALFYGKHRRRREVHFGSSLRARTESLARRLHELTHAGKTPPAIYEKKCSRCSLLNLCLPKITTGKKNVRRYLSSALGNIDEPNGAETPCGTC